MGNHNLYFIDEYIYVNNHNFYFIKDKDKDM